MKKTINEIVAEQIQDRLKRYYEMNDLEKAQYIRKLNRDIEAGQEASAQIHTEALINRCRGLDD